MAAAEIPTMAILDEAVTLAARPVPNLGFACLNATLRAQKPVIFTNRDCIKARMGLPINSLLMNFLLCGVIKCWLVYRFQCQ